MQTHWWHKLKVSMLAEADSSYNTTTEKQNADANELKTKCIYCVTTDGAQIQKEQ